MGRMQRHPYAEADGQTLGTLQGELESLRNAMRGLQGQLLGSDAFQKDRKLVSADTSSQIDLPDSAPQTVRHLTQNGISSLVAQFVVDGLESV